MPLLHFEFKTYCVEEILSYLKRCQNSTAEFKKCRTCQKLSSSNGFGDFVSHCSIKPVGSCHEENLSKELQQIVEDSQNDLRAPIVKFSLYKNNIYFKLNRFSTIKSVLSDIFQGLTTYGYSRKLSNKTFRLCYKVCDNELTQLRTRRAVRVLSQLIAAGGGSVVESSQTETETVSLQVGSVHIAGSNTTSQTDYFQLRGTELESSDHKGLSEQLIKELVNATVMFDLLSVKLGKPLMLSSSIIPTSSTRSNCKGATFVIYNYARVCAILDRFNDMVSKGVYKPLPSCHDIDYNLLLKEEEWRLVFDFLAGWPLVVAECQDLNEPKIHNLVIFLTSFASSFSVFYKYNRVLNDGQPHMVPLMEARIHLLAAIQKIFQIAFSLFGINPPTKM